MGSESLPGLPEAVKPWDEIKAVMFGEVGTPGSISGIRMVFFCHKGTTFFGWSACLENTLGRQKKRQRNLIGFDVFVGTWTCYAHLYTINCSQMLIIMLWTSRKSHEIQKFGRISSCEHFSVYHAHANHYQLQVKPAMEPTMDPETSRFRQMVESLLDEDGVEPCFWRKNGEVVARYFCMSCAMLVVS